MRQEKSFSIAVVLAFPGKPDLAVILGRHGDSRFPTQLRAVAANEEAGKK